MCSFYAFKFLSLEKLCLLLCSLGVMIALPHSWTKSRIGKVEFAAMIQIKKYCSVARKQC